MPEPAGEIPEALPSVVHAPALVTSAYPDPVLNHTSAEQSPPTPAETLVSKLLMVTSCSATRSKMQPLCPELSLL